MAPAPANSKNADRMETIVSLSKRRGFVFPSSEIYGGLRASWDYGPLGVELKNNIKRQWWRSMVQGRDDIVGLDSCVILAREVWEASGHVREFVDPLTECQSCHKRFRADHLTEAFEVKHGRQPAGLAEINCPNCGNKGTFTEPKMFNGLLRTFLGPVEDESGLAYLRPETAQGIFINFLNVQQSARRKPPFGIAQQGKSFRNEITPGNFIFRTREFEQMEMEFFVEPGTDETWHQYWIDTRLAWFTDLGIKPGQPASVRAPCRQALALLEAHRRHRVPLQLRRYRVGRARGHRQPDRLRPQDPLGRLRQGPVLPRPERGRAVHPVRHRAGGGRRPLAAGVPARLVLRGRGADRQGRRRDPYGPAARPAPRPGQGRRAAALAQRATLARCQGPRGGAAQAVERRVRRRRRHRPPLPPAGRDRHAVLHHRRLRDPRRPGGDDSRARLDAAGTDRPGPGGDVPARPTSAPSDPRLPRAAVQAMCPDCRKSGTPFTPANARCCTQGGAHHAPTPGPATRGPAPATPG